MSVDRDVAPSHFPSVGNGGSVHVFVLSPEKSLDSGREDLEVVDWNVLEEDDVPNLGNYSLFLPGYSEASSGIILGPERVLEV